MQFIVAMQLRQSTNEKSLQHDTHKKPNTKIRNQEKGE